MSAFGILLTVLRNIGTNAFFFSPFSFEVFFSRYVFFYCLTCNNKKRNILMTQRAEGICVEKNGHAKSYQTVCSGRGGLFTDTV